MIIKHSQDCLGYHLAMVSTRGFSVVVWEVLVDGVGSVAWLIAGLWAQHCCRIPPGDDEAADGTC